MLDADSKTSGVTSWVQAYVDNFSMLTRFANKLTGYSHHAEDMVVDAFFRLTSAPSVSSPAIKSRKDQLNYLFQIIRNLAIDHYRKQALVGRYITPAAEDEDLSVNEISPQVICEDWQALEQLADALAELPERTRYAFQRHRVDGVPQKEIAKELGVSPTLVNFMIRDALAHCSKIL